MLIYQANKVIHIINIENTVSKYKRSKRKP